MRRSRGLCAAALSFSLLAASCSGEAATVEAAIETPIETEEPAAAPAPTLAPAPTPAPEAATVALPAIDVVDLATGQTASLSSFSRPGATLVWFWAPH